MALRTFLVCVLVCAGCAASSDDAEQDRSSSTEGNGPPQVRQPPGSPIVDGLAVPEGAELLGSPFVRPPIDTGGRSTTDETVTAALAIDGDPFEVFDALATQLRAEPIAAPMAGSSASCQWYPLVGEQTQGPLPESQRVTDEEPPAGSFLICRAGAEGSERSYTVEVGALAGEPPYARIRIDPIFGEPRTPGSPPDVERVPDVASGFLPDAVRESAATGEPFGRAVNCFVDGGPRFVVPSGAALVGDAGDVSVLASTDLPAAMDDLLDQMAGGPHESDIRKERLTGSEGEPIDYWSHYVSGGGGTCELTTSPDGHFLLIERFSD